MKTYWEYCWDEYPLGSWWRDKGTGNYFMITRLDKADSLTVNVRFESRYIARYIAAPNVYAEMERV
jgi:hypothetical protein